MNLSITPTDEFHTLRCFADLLEYCKEIKNLNLFDINKFKNHLIAQINKVICNEPEKWYTDYVCKPSSFFECNNKFFKYINRDLAQKEADMILQNQLSDGSIPVTWQWYTDYKEFKISKNWWKSHFIINNMLICSILKCLIKYSNYILKSNNSIKLPAKFICRRFIYILV